MSPTARSLKYLKDNGYIAQVVERFNPFSHTRLDLFGFIDIVAVKKGEMGVLGVQSTSSTNTSHRVNKSKNTDLLSIWLATGNKFEIHGWGKKGKSGKRKLWTLDRRTIEP